MVQPQVQVPYGGTVAWTAVGLPPGVSINAETGLMYGTVAVSASTTAAYSVTVTASLGAAGSDAETFAWTVLVSEAELEISPVPDQEVLAGQAVSLAMEAIDPNGQTLTFSAENLPPGLSINTMTGVISGTISPSAANGPRYRTTITVSNGTESNLSVFFWRVTSLQLGEPTHPTSVEGSSVNFSVPALQSGTATLLWTATGLPPGVSIDPQTGIMSGTITAGAADEHFYVANVTASDGVATASASVLWTITLANNSVPTMADPGTITNTIGDEVEWTLTATDADDDLIIWEVTGLPEGLDFDWAEGVVFGTVADTAVGTTQVTLSAADGNGGSVTRVFSWVVDDVVPTLDGQDITILKGASLRDHTLATLTGGRTDWSEADYTATIEWGDGASSPVWIDGNSGDFTIGGWHVYDEPGTYTATISVTSPSGAVVQTTATITVEATPILAVGDQVLDAKRGLATEWAVASFRVADWSAEAADYTATVQWGDGLTSQGTIRGDDGVFVVFGSHPYVILGTHTFTVTIVDAFGESAAVTGIVEVSSVLTGETVALSVGAFSASSTASASDFTATITWGDGSQSESVVVGDSGIFSVLGDHTFARVGSQNVLVVVTDAQGRTVSWSESLKVGHGRIRTYAATRLEVMPGETLTNAPVAWFVDPNYTHPASKYSATIDWGDGTPLDTGTVDGGNGLYRVLGTHTPQGRSYQPVKVTVWRLDPDPPIDIALLSMTLAAAAVTPVVVSGQIMYDSAAPKPLRGAYVVVYGSRAEDWWNWQVGIYTYTDDQGKFSITMPDASYTDLKYHIIPESEVADLANPNRRSILVRHWDRQVAKTTAQLPKGPHTGNISLGTVIVDQRHFWIFDAALTAARFQENLKLFPGSTDGPSSNKLFYVQKPRTSLTWNDEMYIIRPDYEVWDTIIHEYGHTLQQQKGFFPFDLEEYAVAIVQMLEPGFIRGDLRKQLVGAPMAHQSEVSMHTVYQKLPYLSSEQLAFNEGFANFFSMAAQDWDTPGRRAGASAPKVIAAGGAESVDDKLYGHTLETGLPIHSGPPGPAGSGYSGGETEELTVMRILWDLYDNQNNDDYLPADPARKLDSVKQQARDLFRWLFRSKPQTLGELWCALYNRTSTKAKANGYYDFRVMADYGAVFEVNNVSARLVGTDIGAARKSTWSKAADPVPTFVWESPMGSPAGVFGNPIAGGTFPIPAAGPNLRTFGVLFYDDTGKLLSRRWLSSTEIATTPSTTPNGADTIKWAPAAAEWQALTGKVPATADVHWVIFGTRETDTSDLDLDVDTYWSGSRVISIKP